MKINYERAKEKALNTLMNILIKIILNGQTKIIFEVSIEILI